MTAFIGRREFITLLGGAAAAWPVAARAQQAGRIPRIGYLSPGSASGGFQARDEAFRQALRVLGYVESSTIAIQYRFAEGRFARLPELAAELVRLNVDVIVAVVTQASLAAKDATNSIPIVMVAVSDPVSSGLVASLRHPGAGRQPAPQLLGGQLGDNKVAKCRQDVRIAASQQIIYRLPLRALAGTLPLGAAGDSGAFAGGGAENKSGVVSADRRTGMTPIMPPAS